MVELAKRFIGKECVIYFSNGQMTATIEEVSDGALMVKGENGTIDALNLDYIVRICDPPRNKKGKIKAIF